MQIFLYNYFSLNQHLWNNIQNSLLLLPFTVSCEDINIGGLVPTIGRLFFNMIEHIFHVAFKGIYIPRKAISTCKVYS